MSRLHPTARALIEAAKRGETPMPPGIRSRVRTSVLRRAAAFGLTLTSTTAVSVAAKGGALAAALASPLVSASAIGAAGTVAFLVARAVWVVPSGPMAVAPHPLASVVVRSGGSAAPNVGKIPDRLDSREPQSPLASSLASRAPPSAVSAPPQAQPAFASERVRLSPPNSPRRAIAAGASPGVGDIESPLRAADLSPPHRACPRASLERSWARIPTSLRRSMCFIAPAPLSSPVNPNSRSNGSAKGRRCSKRGRSPRRRRRLAHRRCASSGGWMRHASRSTALFASGLPLRSPCDSRAGAPLSGGLPATLRNDPRSRARMDMTRVNRRGRKSNMKTLHSRYHSAWIVAFVLASPLLQGADGCVAGGKIDVGSGNGAADAGPEGSVASADGAVGASDGAGNVADAAGSVADAADSAVGVIDGGAGGEEAGEGGGACQYPVNVQLTGDASVVVGTGCFAGPQGCQGGSSETCSSWCSASDYVYDLSQRRRRNAGAPVPNPDPTFGCTILALPTPMNESFYCCPCEATGEVDSGSGPG